MKRAIHNQDVYNNVLKSFRNGCTAKQAAFRVMEKYPDWAAEKQGDSKHKNQILIEISSLYVTKGVQGFTVDKTVRPAIIRPVREQASDAPMVFNSRTAARNFVKNNPGLNLKVVDNGQDADNRWTVASK